MDASENLKMFICLVGDLSSVPLVRFCWQNSSSSYNLGRQGEEAAAAKRHMPMWWRDETVRDICIVTF